MAFIETKFGAAELLWGAENPRNLGTTLDGGTLLYEALCEEQVAHETGTSPHRIFVVGRNVRIETELLQSTLENLMLAISDGVLRSDPLEPENQALDISPYAGNTLAADRLVVHPLKAESSEDDIVIWKAVVEPKVMMLYHAEKDRVLPVTFKALVDEDEAGRLRIARIGDCLIVPTSW
jgi:hypothetical protein